MTRARRLAGAGAILAAVALLVPIAPAGAADRAARAQQVRVKVTDITPSTPEATTAPSRLTVTLTLTNLTTEDFHNIRVAGQRGYPISSQETLDKTLAHPAPPRSNMVPFQAHPPVTLSLAAGATTTVIFDTTTSTTYSNDGICLCHQGAIYPLFFSVHTVAANGVDQLLGKAVTYLPAFDNLPTDFSRVAPNRVSWIWPLLDRPHRLTQDTVFTDDELAAEVAPDGRLSRALAVVADLPPTFPITLLVDPDLLDELKVMANASKPYTVMTSDGKTVPGAGQADASSWLSQLDAVLSGHPQAQLELTPYADPDVESLTARGLTWSDTMPGSMPARVSSALSGQPLTGTLAWPATGAISRPTLRKLATQDVNTVVLNSAAVRTGVAAGEIAPGLVRLRVGPNKDVAAALTTPAIEKYVSLAVTLGKQGSAALPALLAELAIRPIQDPGAEHAVTITAPRYVNPDVTAAVRTIMDTSSSVFAQPISLAAAVADDLMPIARSHLAPVPASATARAFDTLTAAAHATGTLPTVRTLLDSNDAGAASFEQSLPVAIQRAQSAAWRFPGNAAAGRHFARALNDTIDEITSGVRIVQSAHTYTFGSNTAPLPITVDNELPYPVHIRISIVANPPVLGFQAKDIGRQSVEARQKRTFNIPTTIEHAGRIRIQARLFTGGGDSLGAPPIQVTVRSTALGLIGVVITIVAGVVLALALLWRLIRRLRHRRASGGPPAVARVAEPEPVG